MTLTPSRESSSLSCLRHASRSVMSASSLCVTCGIITQLRASTGPEIRWIRERCTRSISPNLEKSTVGHGGRSRPSPGPSGAGAGARRATIHKRLDVLLGDAALAPAAAHVVQVDAKFTGDAPDGGARVDGPTAIGLRTGRGGGRWRWRGRRGLLLGLHRALHRVGGLRFCRCSTATVARRRQRQQLGPLGNPIPNLHQQLAHSPGLRRRHVHRRLVGLERQQWIVDGDRVARRDQNLDHRHVGEVADVRDFDRECARGRAHTCVGIGASASIL